MVSEAAPEGIIAIGKYKKKVASEGNLEYVEDPVCLPTPADDAGRGSSLLCSRLRIFQLV